MHKYNVTKDCLNPWGTEIKAGSVVEYSDVDLQDENVKTIVDALVAEGSLVEIVDAPPAVLVDYVVVQGPVSNPEGEVFQTGNALQLPEGDIFAEDMVKAGLIMTKEEHDKLPKEVPAAAASSVGAPTTPSVAGSTEPRPRYRGQVVISDGMRTVGVQTFHHIRLADGSELDLTAREYSTEVKVSYPPEN